MSMTASEVAAYLEAHPEFFDQHSELLTQVRVPHARSEYAVPLVERQVLALRDKNRQLGAKMSQLIRFGEHNDQTITRLHALSVQLVRTEEATDAIHRTLSALEKDFDITHAGLRLWGTATESLGEWHRQDPRLAIIARNLEHPYTGPFAAEHIIEWFPREPVLQSFGQVALRRDNGEAFGLLVLASADSYRFTTDMETDYLANLGALLSAALQRTLAMH
ncbi:DUF484 family protein [Rivihabitans pingtungensis]|uniref:DUF484 family protein n=1 Tax=Rivihabitans pingtungensis TaxID=1054498 RepID=UPI0023EF5FFE|nr:DUF484 family protein [Rivihabitans pingtungensis]